MSENACIVVGMFLGFIIGFPLGSLAVKYIQWIAQ